MGNKIFLLENERLRLLRENEELRRENKELEVERVIKVIDYPAHYERNMKELEELKKENEKLKDFIRLADISTLQMTIAELKSSCDLKLRKIGEDIQLLDGIERRPLEELVDFFEKVVKDLKDMLHI